MKIAKDEIEYAKNIVKEVCKYYNIKTSSVYKKGRQEDVADIRSVCQYFIRKKLHWSLSDVASFFNRKDHGTVKSNIDKIKFYLEVYENWREEIKELDFIFTMKGRKLDNKDLMMHCTFLFMVRHPELFVKTGTTENDIRYLSDRFKLDGQFLDYILLMKKKHEKIGNQDDEEFNKNHQDELNVEEEPIKKPNDGKDTFGI